MRQDGEYQAALRPPPITITLSWLYRDGTTFNCKTGSGSVTWCTRSIATNRYGLYWSPARPAPAALGAGRLPGQLELGLGLWRCLCMFSYTAQSTSSLAKLHIDLPVNVRPSMTVERYELVDDIALRNSTRS